MSLKALKKIFLNNGYQQKSDIHLLFGSNYDSEDKANHISINSNNIVVVLYAAPFAALTVYYYGFKK